MLNTRFKLSLRKTATRRRRLPTLRSFCFYFIPFSLLWLLFSIAIWLISDVELASSTQQLYLAMHRVVSPLFQVLFPIKEISLYAVDFPEPVSRALLII